jgi:hypothetical protein
MLFLMLSAAYAGDSDKDAVSNKTDQCKEEPEDADGFQDEDGCPDPDNDGDGLLDADDQCKGEAEDKDGHADEDGCADPDNDEDGVLDADDKCASEKESGEDKDGCALVDLTLLSNNGYMPAVSELSQVLLTAVGNKTEGCELAATSVKKWLADNDAATLAAEWEARLTRAPEGFDKPSVTELLAQKNGVYQTLKPAIAVYCKDHEGWTAVAGQVDAVFAPLPVPTPAPAPTKKKKG